MHGGFPGHYLVVRFLGHYFVLFLGVLFAFLQKRNRRTRNTAPKAKTKAETKRKARNFFQFFVFCFSVARFFSSLFLPLFLQKRNHRTRETTEKGKTKRNHRISEITGIFFFLPFSVFLFLCLFLFVFVSLLVLSCSICHFFLLFTQKRNRRTASKAKMQKTKPPTPNWRDSRSLPFSLSSIFIFSFLCVFSFSVDRLLSLRFLPLSSSLFLLFL